MNSQQAQANVTETTTDTVTSQGLLGQEVYSRTGRRVGQVQDLVIDFDAQRIDGLLITDVNTELFTQDSVPKEFVVPYSWIQDADSIVITVPISAERVDFR